MRITAEQPQSTSVDLPSPTANQAKNERTSTPSSVASTVEKASTSANAAIVPPAQRQTDVTFRRDSNGRVYYPVSDAHSGQEILKRPEIVRDVGQGIEDYLKNEESKTTSHVEVKA